MTERKLAAILSADVVGYSRLMAEDEDDTVRRLADYRDQVELLVRQHRGRLVDFTGDNFLAEFPTALDAVRCAVEIQRVLATRNADLPEDRRMEFRIGAHLGDIRVEGERIYGDGVNIAARLEGLAEPGGICVSATLHEQVEKKLSLGFEDLGEQEVKNIARPIRVFAVRLDSTRPPAPTQPGSENDPYIVAGFGGAPAIAVLAFDNLSRDPDQEYFADGIAEDLITCLSTCRQFPVIARNSSFVYKGRAVDVKQVSRELGVRYVVEGSVRRSGDRVRITAQLIDATTGAHVWAERYDRELRDVFELQDEITESIAGAMQPGLWEFERERARRVPPRNLDAWELAQRGWWHFWQFSREDFVQARLFFTRALELDPDSASACSGLSLSHSYEVLFEWADSPPESFQQAMALAQRSASLDASDVFSQLALGVVYALTGQREELVAAAERALELNPSLALAHLFLGRTRVVTGRADEGIEHIEKAMRLSPKDPLYATFLYALGLGHFAAGRTEVAVEWMQRGLKQSAGQPPLFEEAGAIGLAAALALLDRTDEAHAALERVRSETLHIELLTRPMAIADADFREQFIEGLRKAGLPE